MKLLSFIDTHILNFWYTAPSERLWAYLATLPVLLLIIDGLAQLTK
ncbi:hypothetical protein H5S40_00865 [Limosilactobacillus sp. RRLNB_1_1]|uniref:Uncharacterized protein n=1 Tax=Limosilactobacillus albertensis TaxID=2759752 RepID=A0A7W3TQ81_9LACO|nr:hypothetical protein [Limosilactobacillus albertensis]MBB1068748.1 hypothetical protein [Limosilactobacillus albertensis]MCD7118307.1 hypothetical protein [Limosilactobacillus albertensis]MCD7127515.1 hypothetical protein [Limosilactobacillus albertensis]